MYRFQEIGKFFQKKPKISNAYLTDSLLQRFAKTYFPSECFNEVSQDFTTFGNRIANEIEDLNTQCEENPPRHRSFDAWGNRTDELITCHAWKQMKRISAEEGLISIAYERKYGEHSRVYQLMKNYLFGPVSGLYSCPLAMTDGAAKTIERMDLKHSLSEAYSKLTSRDPNGFWTSGQWMTERKGGSDVANGTETIAIPESDGTFKLYGYKWFSSATDADMSLTLARIADENGNYVEGNRGLSLFYLELFDRDTGKLNGIQIQKLKNKLGTRQLPTAELLLAGAKSHCLSEPGRGIPNMTSMLMICRAHTALHGIASMRRIITLARDYSLKREAFGRPIKDYPLHMQTLARMEVDCRAAFLFMMEVSRLIGKDDVNCISAHEELILRILVPLLKLYTSKQTVRVVSEGLECFGGQGYIEDTGLPSILRDAQVLPIWEGTTNVLSLDVLRSIAKSRGETLNAFQHEVQVRCEKTASRCPDLASYCEYVSQSANLLFEFVGKYPHLLEPAARDLAYSLARTYMAMLLLEFGSFPDSHPTDIAAAKRWCSKRNLMDIVKNHENKAYSKKDISTDYELVMEDKL